VEIRRYSENDRRACLDILDENTPEYFVVGDRASLDDFLGGLPGPYFVAEEEGRVIACGGWAMTSGDSAVLTWGMVRRALHRRGIGRSMLRFRLDSIKAEGRASVVEVQTVQLVQRFFAREGFSVVNVVPDGFGQGLDRVTMELQLATSVSPDARSPSGPAPR
jgi:N-acetylglutamate synthase-like GNAT family acetyltransferase